jgi:hypothetical protein
MDFISVGNRHYCGRYTIIENDRSTNGGRVDVWWSSHKLGAVQGLERAKRLCDIHLEQTLKLPSE